MSESYQNGSPTAALLLGGSESRPLKHVQHSGNAWTAEDCQAAVTSKGESYSKSTAEARAVSNPVMQFNVGTVRNPVSQEDELP